MVSYLLPIGAEALISRVLRLRQFPTPEFHLSKQDYSIVSQLKGHATLFTAV